MMPGRFMLGVGTGENLNEHVLGDHWPPAETRRDMLEEAIEIIRLLWEGGSHTHYTAYYVVENARIYTLPEQPPPIFVAASGPLAGELAGRTGDGLVATSPDREVIDKFREAGGHGKPILGEVTVCWAKKEADARRIAFEHWPNAALPGELAQQLPTPAHFEQAMRLVREEDVVKDILCGPDPDPILEAIRKYADAGFDHVWLHQVGPDQEGFLRFAERELLPKLKELAPEPAAR
jgi:G6PDH family F420-dependent oxidoreductase